MNIVTGDNPRGISIEGINLIRLEFALNTSHSIKANDPIRAHFSFEVTRTFPTPEKLEVRVRASVFEGADDAPFSVVVEYGAKFQSLHVEDNSLLRSFAKSNAPGILLPYIRESISSVAMKAGVGGFILPPMIIDHIVSDAERMRDEADS